MSNSAHGHLNLFALKLLMQWFEVTLIILNNVLNWQPLYFHKML